MLVCFWQLSEHEVQGEPTVSKPPQKGQVPPLPQEMFLP